TRAGFLATIRKLGTFDLDGVRLTYGPNDNQGLDQVFFTVIQANGSLAAVEGLSGWPDATGG
ncbi:MAG: ABC transporter substrate-binding protein, partial [Geminicoccaceae bacterium]